jgi:SAM-dependent methyltransferase
VETLTAIHWRGFERSTELAQPSLRSIVDPPRRAPALATACPLCSQRTAESIFKLRNSPPLQNKLLRNEEEARAAVRLSATYLYCAACHFAFNPTFDPSLVDYAKYYNGQLESASYRGYVDKIAVDLATAAGLGPESRILEIGCGSGYFLSCLQKATGSGAVIGYDPTYRGEYGMQDYVRRRLLDTKEVEGTFDLIVLRHSLEGLLNDASLAELIRKVTSPSSRLYLEVTDLDHLLTERNPSLLFYEYYRYFSARAADIFLRKLGFRLQQLWSLFGGSYLGITASRAPTTIDLSDAYCELEGIVRRHRKVLVWGTSGRCISLLCHMGWDSRVVAFGVDIDPEKQGLFIPITGQKILTPAEGVAFGPDLVIVANENYAAEIRKQFTGDVRLVSLQGRYL